MRRLAWALALAAAACAPQVGVPVRLTVYHAGAPASGATLWWSDAESDQPTVLGTTDGAGVLATLVPEGAAVTAAIAEGTSEPRSWRLHTVLGVREGDELSLGLRAGADSAPRGTLSVTLPGAAAGATGYQVSAGCDVIDTTDAALPIVLMLSDKCITADGRAVVQARALDGSAQAVAFSTAVVAVTSGGAASVSLDPWSTDLAPLKMSFANIPASAAAARSELSVFHDRIRFDQPSALTTMPAAVVEHAFAYGRTTLASRLLCRQSIAYGPTASSGTQILVRSFGGSQLPTSQSFDVAARGLPRIESTQGNIGANNSPLLTWQVAGAPPLDGLAAYAEWLNPSGAKIRWTLFGPASGATTQSFPRIPESLEGVRGVRAVRVDPAVYLVEAEHLIGYDDFRRAGAALFDTTLPAIDLHVRLSTSGVIP